MVVCTTRENPMHQNDLSILRILMIKIFWKSKTFSKGSLRTQNSWIGLGSSRATKSIMRKTPRQSSRLMTLQIQISGSNLNALTACNLSSITRRSRSVAVIHIKKLTFSVEPSIIKPFCLKLIRRVSLFELEEHWVMSDVGPMLKGDMIL